MRLFVYGTLKRGDVASGLLLGCEHLGPAVVRGTLYDVDGRFPALVLEGDGSVQGELWSCTGEVLDRLDGYEGVEQGLFRRETILVGGEVCWTYVAGPMIERRLESCAVIPDGTWRPRRP